MKYKNSADYDGVDLFDTLNTIDDKYYNNEGRALTLEDFEKFKENILSEENWKENWNNYVEQQRKIGEGQTFIYEALKQKVITEAEFYMLCTTIQINGALIVSPKMAEKLKNVKETHVKK
jgi:hypothetical protein